MFDWPRFLSDHGIEYVTEGANVARNNIGIRCPFCGDDPSHHMGISLSGRGWSCWRREGHRGKHPAKLIAALLGCGFARARAYVEADSAVIDDFEGQMEALLKSEEATIHVAPAIPREFRRFSDERITTIKKPYYRYLMRRGYTPKQIIRLTDRYQVYYAMRGPFAGRIIFVIEESGIVTSWTGRAVTSKAKVRYKALTTDPASASLENLQPAIRRTTDSLLWYDTLRKTKGDALFITEGPFDALKIAVLGRSLGAFATCIFTSHASRRQLDLLHDILPNFKRRIVLLDDGALAVGTRIAAELSGLAAEAWPMPEGVKDPGELTRPQLVALLKGEQNAKAAFRYVDGRETGEVDQLVRTQVGLGRSEVDGPRRSRSRRP